MIEEVQGLARIIHSGEAHISECIQRIIHGRGGAFPAYSFLNVDYYSPVLVIVLFEFRSAEWVSLLGELLEKRFPQGRIQDRSQAKSPWVFSWGNPPEELIIREGTFVFKATFAQHQNWGFFPDMKMGREWVRGISQGKKVLNLFAYTCSLSVAACCGGATSVINVDLSSRSLSTGKDNHRLNQCDLSKVQFYAEDILRSFGRLKRRGPYDLIIVDPPSFQKGSFSCSRDYKKIIRRVPEMLQDGGYLMLCLNSPSHTTSFLSDLMTDFDECAFVESLLPSEGFPEINPERGLKIQIYQKVSR